MEMIKFNYMLEIDILRNSSPKKVGVLRGAFEGSGLDVKASPVARASY